MQMENKRMWERKKLSSLLVIINENYKVLVKTFKEVCQGKTQFFLKHQNNLNKHHSKQNQKSILASILIKNHQNHWFQAVIEVRPFGLENQLFRLNLMMNKIEVLKNKNLYVQMSQS